MKAGALGIGSALIYSAGHLMRKPRADRARGEAAKYQGKYTSHVRDEGKGLVEAIEELIRISQEAGIPAQIHHIKASGKSNWGLMDRALEVVEEARAKGAPITANMYMYPASSTGLSAQIPTWAHSGGNEALFKRLQSWSERARIAREMRAHGPMSPTMLVNFRSQKLRALIGRMLADVAGARRGQTRSSTWCSRTARAGAALP